MGEPPPCAYLPVEPLSRDGQLAAQRTLVTAYRINPLGSSILSGQVVFLLALEYGASDLAMGLLYGGIWLAGGAAFLAPAICARMDPARVTANSWLLRTVLCLPYLLLPFMPDAAKVPVIVVTFLIFMSIRTVGIAAFNVATAAYCRPDEGGRLIAASHFWWHIGTLVVTVASTAVLARWPGSEFAYIGLIACAIAASFVTGAVMRRMPAAGTHAHEPLREAIPRVARDRGVREALAATLLVVPQAVAAAYQLNVLKGPLDLAADRITALTLGAIMLSIIATRVLGLLLPRTGLRPVQLGVHAALALLGLAWAFGGLVPEAWRVPWSMALYVIGAALLAVSTAILAALHVDRLPKEGTMAASALFLVAGAIAGVLGVGLVWATSHLGLESLPGAGPYAHAFLVWAACSAGGCALGIATGGTAQVLADLKLLSPANLVGLLWSKR